MKGKIDLLHVQHGHLEVQFENPAQAKREIDDLMRKGYLFIITIDGQDHKVTGFDGTTGEYITTINRKILFWEQNKTVRVDHAVADAKAIGPKDEVVEKRVDMKVANVHMQPPSDEMAFLIENGYDTYHDEEAFSQAMAEAEGTIYDPYDKQNDQKLREEALEVIRKKDADHRSEVVASIKAKKAKEELLAKTVEEMNKGKQPDKPEAISAVLSATMAGDITKTERTETVEARVPMDKAEVTVIPRTAGG